MLASLLGAVASKQSGGSAIKGAITGKAAMMGLRLLGPVAGAAAVGFAAFKGWQKYQENSENKPVETGEVVNDNNGAALGSAAVTKEAA